MANFSTGVGCPDCDSIHSQLYVVQPGGCRAAFLSILFLIGLPVAFGIITHFNVWAWMLSPSVYLWHVFAVMVPTFLLTLLIIRKVFRLNPWKRNYLECNRCRRRFLWGPGGQKSRTVIPIQSRNSSNGVTIFLIPLANLPIRQAWSSCDPTSYFTRSICGIRSALADHSGYQNVRYLPTHP